MILLLSSGTKLDAGVDLNGTGSIILPRFHSYYVIRCESSGPQMNVRTAGSGCQGQHLNSSDCVCHHRQNSGISRSIFDSCQMNSMRLKLSDSIVQFLILSWREADRNILPNGEVHEWSYTICSLQISSTQLQWHGDRLILDCCKEDSKDEIVIAQTDQFSIFQRPAASLLMFLRPCHYQLHLVYSSELRHGVWEKVLRHELFCKPCSSCIANFPSSGLWICLQSLCLHLCSSLV